ncbi:MAG: hypothetical protein LBQ94_01155 [Treponema sp.]|nr:hypothetical protein [Treponema sp.]
MKSGRLSKEKFLYLLVNRLAIFFFLMCILTLFLYAAGTIQDFIDSTQLFLLNLYFILGIFLTIASVSGLLLDLNRFSRTKKRRYLLRAGGYVFLVVFGVVTVFAASAITAISGL